MIIKLEDKKIPFEGESICPFRCKFANFAWGLAIGFCIGLTFF